MADLLAAQDTDALVTEGDDLIALQSDTGVGLAATVTLAQNQAGSYDVGDVPVFTATFLDGAAVDPVVVVFTFRLFDGSETSHTYGTSARVDTTGVGVYTFVAPELTQHGKHVCRVDGTEPHAAAERVIGVRLSKFANP